MLRGLLLLALLAIQAPGAAQGDRGASAMPGYSIPASSLLRVERDIVDGPWAQVRPMSDRCPVVHVLLSRSCVHCQAFVRDGMDALDRAGVGMRLHFASVVGVPRPIVAEVALRRDPAVTMRAQLGLLTTAPSLEAAERAAAYEEARFSTLAFRDIAKEVGYSGYTPAFVWQDEKRGWRMMAGNRKDDLAKLAKLLKPGRECRQRLT